MKRPAWITSIIWTFRVLWRHVNGRWYIFRDAPDEVVIYWISAGDNPDAGDDVVAVSNQAKAEMELRLQLLDRELSNLKCQVPPDGWVCTRGRGHEGPCAAHPAGEPLNGPAP